MSAPAEFLVRLQHGITGGFAPPTPSAIFQLTRSTDNPDQVSIQAQTRASGTPDLQASEAFVLPVGANVVNIASDSPKNVDARVAELESILKELPMDPSGSEDIYGMDVGITFMSNNLEWMNSAPQGCSPGFSTVQVSEEQKAKFKRAVEIVQGLATQ